MLTIDFSFIVILTLEAGYYLLFPGGTITLSGLSTTPMLFYRQLS